MDSTAATEKFSGIILTKWYVKASLAIAAISNCSCIILTMWSKN
ncbi:hypothetical protein [Clostridioides sp. GD02376]